MTLSLPGRIRVRSQPWRPPSPVASAFIRRIEAERRALEKVDREVEFADYGAGTSRDNRSADEMARGLVSQRRIGDICRIASKPPRAARLLFALIREIRPDVCLELGTCLGISTAYQAAALELNGRGFLYSVEGAAPLADEARALLERLGLSHRVEIRTGRFADVLPDLLASHEYGFAFVDGHHDEQATLGYFAQIRPSMQAHGAMLFDDITWSDGMRRAWASIRADGAVGRTWTQLGMGLVEL